MIPKKLIEEKSLENSKLHYILAFSDELHVDADMDFQAGVHFAEDYLKDLAIEFAEFIVSRFGWSYACNAWFYNTGEGVGTTRQLFELFIKEKYGESKE